MADVMDDLRRDESFRAYPYRDTESHLTIGYGRNLDANGITEAEGDMLLANDVRTAIAELDRAATWWRRLPAPAQRALINMAFNLGITKLLRFRKMMAALERNDFEAAAVEALDSKWAGQVGGRAMRIAVLYREALQSGG